MPFFASMPFHQHNDLIMEYRTIGQGPLPMLAFHGFGRSFEDFYAFEEVLGDQFTIYGFNAFCHGNSVFPEERIQNKDTLRMDEIHSFFQNFLEEKGFEQVSLMGYSIGGKIAFTLLQTMPEKVQDFLLFAPDGLKIAWWYKLASRSWLGHWIYRKVEKDPGFFFKLIDLLNKWGIMGQKMHRFIHYHMESREMRKLVGDVWLIFRYIIPDLKLIHHNLYTYDINYHLFLGKYDKIIPPSLADEFLTTEEKAEHLHILETGHVMISEKTADYLSSHRKEIFP